VKKVAVLFVLILATLTITGCSEKIQNQISIEKTYIDALDALLREAGLKKAEINVRYEQVVPDSMKAQMAKWITETVAAGTSNLSTSDYEDPEDLVEEVSDQAEKIFAVNTKFVYLSFIPKDGQMYNSVLCEDLTPSQKRVFDFLNQ